MADDLATYRGKRRFSGDSVTREPDGSRAVPAARRRRSGAGAHDGGFSYVVQEHDARSHHFDFRLELDGTLKSWAIPKGPSEDPSVKRLAVHVEDHPVEYGTFEGEIPKGHYGAGEVKIWDRGSWEPEGGVTGAREGYRAGKLTFHLHGQRLHGKWALVRTRMKGKQAQWLLLKERDQGEEAVAPTTAHAALPKARNARTKASTSGHSSRKSARSGASDWQAIWKRVKAQATRAACPQTLRPQLATLVDAIPEGDAWSYEIKFDGYRIVMRADPAAARTKARAYPECRLHTREGKDWTGRLPEQADALSAWTGAIATMLGGAFGGAWFDGEAVAYDESGVPHFQALQNAFEAHRSSRIVIYLFDIPYLGGYDLRAVPLAERRALLGALLEQVPVPMHSAAAGDVDLDKAPSRAARSSRKAEALLRFSEDFDAPPEQLLSHACALSLEGVIGKRKDSPYRDGRSPSWIKLKCRQRQEFVIAGFTEPSGSRSGLGALLLAVNVKDDAGKNVLRYAGRVGTGFGATLLRSLRKKLDALAAKHPSKRAPVIDPPAQRAGGKVHWVSPQLVAECEFAEWTRDGVLRHASFIQLREDKSPRHIVREEPGMQAASTVASSRRTRAGHADKPSRAPKASHQDDNDTVADVRITHPDRIVDKRSGTHKVDVARYCEWAAPWLLAELRGRPVSLLRVTGDIEGETFFQKHAPQQSIPHVTQHAKLDPGHPPLITIDSVAALVGAAQMGTMEWHTWNARVDSIEKPDRIVFDLDPGAGLPWSRVIEAAQLTRTLLDEIGLTAFCKTSGGKGLHVVVPLSRHASWDAVRDFAQAVAQHMARTLPDRFSAKMGERNRKGKVFVDYLRNNRGASTVAAYSTRARPGVGISVPVEWDELDTLRGGDHWTLATIHERLAQWPDGPTSDDAPWADYGATQQRITAAMRKRLEDAQRADD